MPSDTAFNYQLLGLIKYGLAAGVALLWAVAACAWHVPWLVPLAVVAFYAVEAQMVFLFPVALDGSARPFRRRPALDAPRWRDRRCDASGDAAGLHHAVRRPGRPRLLAELVPRLPGCLPLVRGSQQRPAARRRDLVPARMGRSVRCWSGVRKSSLGWPGRSACSTRATCTWAGGGREGFPDNWSRLRTSRRRT